MRTIYAAIQNSDLTEGRGPMIAQGHFHKESDAEKFAESLPGVMGVGGGDVKEIIVYDSIDEHPSWDDTKVRQSALKKLTPRERKVLGV